MVSEELISEIVGETIDPGIIRILASVGMNSLSSRDVVAKLAGSWRDVSGRFIGGCNLQRRSLLRLGKGIQP
jgi:hypothetical protein